MSGLVVAFGKSNRSRVENMLQRIHHRGPEISGVVEMDGAVMAQNYLRADGCLATDHCGIPVDTRADDGLRICYDGQMGNGQELAQAYGVPKGPCREERLLLRIYQQDGPGMLRHLNDAIFALVISDGRSLFAARDLLGIKTLFYGWQDETLFLGTELKSIVEMTDEVFEFPPGHWMNENGHLTRYAQLPTSAPEPVQADVETMAETVRHIIQKSLRNRVDFNMPVGSLLSGGIDSSVIAVLASDELKKARGRGARLKTFALGLGESTDVQNARVMAEWLDSDHHELIVDLEEILAVLPEVIYYLESFDPSLVRSSVSNYLISRYARAQGIQILLSGEGGDEVFCGYIYLKDYPMEELFQRQMECMQFLHNNASLRLDRMNLCNSVRVVAPLISGELLDYAMTIPPEYKQRPESHQRIEKWIFRKAFESRLPESIVWRIKQEFSQGSGSASLLPGHFEKTIPDEELTELQQQHPIVRTKEELHYFRIFTDHFGSGHSVRTVGQWVLV